MPLRDWMTPDPITAGPSETVREALQRMRRHRVETLPVTLGGTVMGLLHGPTLLRQALDPEGECLPEELAYRPVADFIIEVDPVGPYASEAEALALMRRAGSSEKYRAGMPGLPVVEAGRLVGMITMDNLGEFVMIRGALHAGTGGSGVSASPPSPPYRA